MRICLVAESYPPALGGAEYALEKVVEGFIAKGHEVRVITSSWQRHASGVESHGALTIRRVYTFPYFKRLWFILFSLPYVIQAARWADIVQGSMFAGGPPAFFGACVTGTKKVLMVYEVFGARWFELEPNLVRSLFYFFAERTIVHLPFTRYIAISEYTKEALQSIGLPSSKIDVIYYGDSLLSNPTLTRKEVRTQIGVEDESFVFISYGRTGVTKGFEYFVEAIPEISRCVPTARFFLILSNYDNRIWTRIQKIVHSLPPHVCTLIPSVSREMLASYVSAADCVVIPSLSEGFGFCAREACNANKIIVATNAGALPEVISGKHIWVNAGSSQALVEGCVKAYKGEVMEGTPKIFDWDSSASHYCEVYEALLAS
jgi:D-inositol-3-phosphate glycosyltransferase